MNNNEIKTIIVLTGNKRIPHLEEEIFADIELTTLYLHNLYKELQWYTTSSRNTYLAYIYVRDIMHERWLPAEAVIKLDSLWWSLYSTVVGMSSL